MAWSVAESPEGRHLKLSWIECGGPPPPASITRGFGSTLLSMYGDAVTALTEKGLEYSLTVPWSEVLKGPPITKAKNVRTVEGLPSRFTRDRTSGDHSELSPK